MQPLACDLWLMEDVAFRQFKSLTMVRIDAEMARAAASVTPKRQGKVGVIPVHGVIEARPSMVGEMLGMSSYERIGQAFDVLQADDTVTGIIFDIASPGGMVYGAQELGQKIFAARGRKPVFAVANPLMASGALWPFAAADRVVGTVGADLGSVGVIAEHVDLSQALEKAGEKVTVIRSKNSPFKAESNDAEPLSDTAKGHMEHRANEIYERFVGDLAKYRGVSVDHVNQHFGKGRVMNIKDAIAAGMADRVDSLEGVAGKLMEGRIRLGGAAVLDQWDAPTRREERLERVAAIQRVATMNLETEAVMA